MVQKLIRSHKSIIALNGQLPPPSIMDSIHTEVTVIASDGGAKKLMSLNITPNFIVGDADSYESAQEMIQINDQDTTDFEKSLFFAQEKDLFPALVLGINGGEIDHILGNVQVMMRYAHKYPMYFLDTYEVDGDTGLKIGIPLTDTVELDVEPGSTLSVIPTGSVILSSKGLKWELDKTTVGTDETLGMRNETTSNHIEIKAHSGKALIILDI